MSRVSKITASELVLSAIFFLQQKNGVTAKDITKFICEKRGCKQRHVKNEVKKALERATKKGIFTQKRGLYRIKSGLGKNIISEKVRKMEKVRKRSRYSRPKSISEEADYELDQKKSFENNIFNFGLFDKRDALRRRLQFCKKETLRSKIPENEDKFCNDTKRIISLERLKIFKANDEDDDDEDFLEEDEDDDDDLDFFADDEFPKPEDALKGSCPTPVKRKARGAKRKGKCRSKSKTKSKAKKRKCSKPRKKCKRRRPMRCEYKRHAEYFKDSSLEEDNGNESENNEAEKEKFDEDENGVECDEDYADDEDQHSRKDGEENERDERTPAYAQTDDTTMSVGNESKENDDCSGNDNADDYCDDNGDDGEEQGNDCDEWQSQEDLDSREFRQYQKQPENIEPEIGQKDKKPGSVPAAIGNNPNSNPNTKNDTKNNAECGTGGTPSSYPPQAPAQEEFPPSQGFRAKKVKREESPAFFCPLVKKINCRKKNTSNLKSDRIKNFN